MDTLTDETDDFITPREIDGQDELICPECGFEAATAHGLSIHIGRQHKGTDARPAGGKPAARRGGGRVNSKDQLREQCAAFVTFVYGMGGSTLMLADPQLGQAVIACADAATDAWFRVALINPHVAKLMRGSSKSSAWLMLVGAHAPLMIYVSGRYLGFNPQMMTAAMMESMQDDGTTNPVE